MHLQFPENLWPLFWRMNPFSERFFFFSQSFLNQQLLNVSRRSSCNFCCLVTRETIQPPWTPCRSRSNSRTLRSLNFLGANFFRWKTFKETKQISICEDVSDIFRMLFWVHGHSTFGMHLIKSSSPQKTSTTKFWSSWSFFPLQGPGGQICCCGFQIDGGIQFQFQQTRLYRFHGSGTLQ